MNNLKTIGCVVLMGLLTAMVGCGGTVVKDSLNTDYQADDITGDLDYWHQLAERPITTNNEALHGLIEFDEGEDACESYEQRVSKLQEKGYLGKSFNKPGDMAVQRGTVAQVLCHMMDIKGGLSMRLFGPMPRYATRELIYLQILDSSTEQQGLSGIEFVGLLSNAEHYMETQK